MYGHDKSPATQCCRAMISGFYALCTDDIDRNIKYFQPMILSKRFACKSGTHFKDTCYHQQKISQYSNTGFVSHTCNFFSFGNPLLQMTSFRFLKDALVIKLQGKLYQGGLLLTSYIASILRQSVRNKETYNLVSSGFYL